MARHNIVVIGASAGGIEAVGALLGGLPKDLPATILVVIHMPPAGQSILARIFSKRTLLDIKEASHGERIQPGTVYIAQPDRHLIVTDGTLELVRGPKENLHRPAVDVLFRSAAYAHGSRVIGVVLTGNLDDGSAGLWAIKSRGGITIVQKPDEALFPDMPRNAIKYSTVDHIESLSNIPSLICRLIEDGNELEDSKEAPHLPHATNPDAPPGVGLAPDEVAPGERSDADDMGKPSYFTCPTCSGTLWEYRDGAMPRYRCRVGHAFSADSMMAEQSESLERALWVAIRTLDERADLLRRLSLQSQDKNLPFARRRIEERHRETQENADFLRQMVTSLRDVDPAHD